MNEEPEKKEESIIKYLEPFPLNQVAEFHEVFNHPILKTPTVPPEERKVLRVGLLTEEVKELQHALKEGDLVEIADAYADIQYVLSGAILETGLGSKFKEIFEEVHRSNMSKLCQTLEDAEATVEHYGGKEVAKIVATELGFIIYRKSDDKVLKSISYTPADIKSIIEKP